jgi:hypothetical protein
LFTSFPQTRPSELRRNILDSELSGAKYAGEKSSRMLPAQDHDPNQSDSASTDSRDEEVVSSTDQRTDASSTAGGNNDGGEDDEDGSSQPRSDPHQGHDLFAAQDLTSALRESRMVDRQKGKAIIKQSVCLPHRESFKTLTDAGCPHSNFGTRLSMLASTYKKRLAAQTSSHTYVRLSHHARRDDFPLKSDEHPQPNTADSHRAISENASALVDLVLQAGLELAEDLFALEEVPSTISC